MICAIVLLGPLLLWLSYLYLIAQGDVPYSADTWVDDEFVWIDPEEDYRREYSEWDESDWYESN
jgi:hypothetical protein